MSENEIKSDREYINLWIAGRYIQYDDEAKGAFRHFIATKNGKRIYFASQQQAVNYVQQQLTDTDREVYTVYAYTKAALEAYLKAPYGDIEAIILLLKKLVRICEEYIKKNH